jgi:hypothetical protein
MGAPKAGEGHKLLERIGGIDVLAEVYNNRERFPSENAIATHFGVSKSAYFKTLRLAKGLSPDSFIDRNEAHNQDLRKQGGGNVVGASFTMPPNPDTDPIDVAALVAQKKRQFDRITAREDALRSVSIKVNIDGPIGILHHGDPHIDDDGTDIHSLERHATLCRLTEGLFAGNVGDGLNNWVGRLARLYGQQSTTEMQAIALLEWWMGQYRTNEGKTKWLYLISGNHDYWHGDARDPVRWIATQHSALHQPSELRMRLELPSGRVCTINARHDFSGHSMWNPAHGVGRAVQMGNWDDISVCGHRHVSGYMILRCPQDDRICHALQVASYKIYDRYAREKGFRDQHVSPAVLTVINPGAKSPAGFVTVFHDIEEGVDYLTYRRKRWARGGG